MLVGNLLFMIEALYWADTLGNYSFNPLWMALYSPVVLQQWRSLNHCGITSDDIVEEAL